MAEIIHNTDAILAAFNRLLAAGQDLNEPMAVIAEILESASLRAFEQEKNPTTGEAWAPLSEVTKARRRNGSDAILRDSSGLFQSITRFADNDSAGVGTNKIYATTQHFGALKGAFKSSPRKVPWGDIPARPFLGLGPDDEEEIVDTLAHFLMEAIEPN